MPDKPYSCYVLWSDLGHCYYIGISEDVDKRLRDHNTAVSKWTKRYAGTWQLVWERQFPTLGEARRFENRLKRQKAGAGFYELTGLSRGRSGARSKPPTCGRGCG